MPFWNIAADSDGHAFFVGALTSGETIGRQTIQPSGAASAIVAMAEPSGTFKWTVSATGPGESYARALARWRDTLYVVGSASGVVRLGATAVSAGAREVGFVAALDVHGAVSWLQRLPDVSLLYVVADQNGDVFVAGYHTQRSLLVAKVHRTGRLLWTQALRSIGGALSPQGGLVADSAGNLFVPCMFFGELRHFGLTATAQYTTVLLLRFDPLGAINIVARGSGREGTMIPYSVVIAGADLYISGGYTGQPMLGHYTFPRSSRNRSAPFLAKIRLPSTVAWVRTALDLKIGCSYGGGSLAFTNTRELLVFGQCRPTDQGRGAISGTSYVARLTVDGQVSATQLRRRPRPESAYHIVSSGRRAYLLSNVVAPTPWAHDRSFVVVEQVFERVVPK